MPGSDALLEETLRFVLTGLERELRAELDWRATPAGTGPIRRTAVYAAALVRDLVRIPLHHPDGIAQARFRVRVRFLERTAIPTVRFFADRYTLSRPRREALATALDELDGCVALVSDGRFQRLDAWYATMDEFRRLSDGCGRAAEAIASVLAEAPHVAGRQPSSAGPDA